MKRFLSALTALCMCASTVASTLPVSALNLADRAPVTAEGKDSAEWNWYVDNATFDASKDDYVEINICVGGTDPGIYSMSGGLRIDGKFPYESGWEVDSIEIGAPYKMMNQFAPGLKEGVFAGTVKSDTVLEDLYAKPGETVLTYTLIPMDGIKYKSSYELSVGELQVANYNEEKLKPALDTGTLTITGLSGDTPTDSPVVTPTDPPEVTPTNQPVTPTNSSTTPPSTGGDRDYKYSDFTWFVKDAYLDYQPDEEYQMVEIEVCVSHDPGTYSVAGGFVMDSKNAEDSGWFIDSIEPAGAYKKLNQFTSGLEKGVFAGVVKSDTILEDLKAGEGETVILITLATDMKIDDMKDSYKLDLTDLSLANFAQQKFTPKNYEGGTLYVKDGPVTPPTTDPVTPPTTDPVTPPATGDPSGDRDYNYKDFTWYVKDAYLDYQPDEEFQMVDVEICVSHDPGTYSVAGGFLMDKKNAEDSGWFIDSIEPVGSYKKLNQFTSGLDKGVFAGVVKSDSILEDLKAAEGETVIVVTLATDMKIDDMKDSYKLNLTNLSLANFAQEKFVPKNVEDGTLYIKTKTPVATDPVDDPTEPPIKTTDPVDDPTEPPVKTTDPVVDPPVTEKESKVSAVWDIADVTVKAGTKASLDVTVTGNEGFNSFIANFKNDAGVKLTGSDNGSLFANLQVIDNIDKLAVAGTESNTKGDLKGDGVVFTLEFDVPAGTKPGVYNVEWTNFSLYNADMVKLIPTLEAGSITIEPEPEDQKTSEIGAQWIIEEYYAEPGELVPLHISVADDTVGLNSYLVELKHDEGIKATGADTVGATAYTDLKFEENYAALKFGATNPVKSADVVGNSGDVFVVYFQVPEDAKPGDHWDVQFANLEVDNIDMVRLIPKQDNGWIEIKKPEPTDAPATEKPTDEQPTTEQPTDPPATEKPTDEQPTTEQPTDPPATEKPTEQQPTDPPATEKPTEQQPTDPPATEPVDTNDIGKWFIGTDTAYPGDVVTIPVYVTGDKNGINSYLTKIGFEFKKWLTGAEEGNAAPELKFVENIDNYTFAGTYYDAANNIVIPDGANVFLMQFTVPEDATPGKYDVTFDELSVYDINMTDLNPERENGWIEILAPPTTDNTEAPTDEETTDPPATEKPTEQQPTDEQPTTEQQPTNEPPTNPPPTEQQPTDEQPTTEQQPTNEPPTNPPPTEQQPTNEPPTNPPPTEPPTDPPATEKPTDPPATEQPTNPPPTNPPATEQQPTNELPTGVGIDETQSQNPTDNPPATDAPETQPVTEAPGVDTPTEPIYSATWEIGHKQAVAGQKNVEIAIKVSGDKNGRSLNSYMFEIAAEEGINFSDYAKGTAYDLLDLQVEYPQFAGTPVDATITNVEAVDGDYVVRLYFNVDENAAPGKYPIKFVGDVEAIRMSMNAIDITEVDGYIEVLPTAPTEEETFMKSYQYIVKGNTKFYFSHDARPFDAQDLLSSLRRRAVYTNAAGDVVGYGDLENVDKSLATIVYDGENNPEAVYTKAAGTLGDEAYVALPLSIVVNDTLPDGSAFTMTIDGSADNEDGAFAYIGVKGDTNLDGEVDASDAAVVLYYSAELGSGNGAAKLYNGTGNAEIMERFVYFLSDIDGESENGGLTTANGDSNSPVDASDAAYQLLFSANMGGGNFDPATMTYWVEGVLAGDDTPNADALPKYTRAIYEWKQSH